MLLVHMAFAMSVNINMANANITNSQSVGFDHHPAANVILIADLQAQQNYSIAKQSLSEALVIFGKQSGVQISFKQSVTKGVVTNGVAGNLSHKQALKMLLSNTELEAEFINKKSVFVRPKKLDFAQAGEDFILDTIFVDTKQQQEVDVQDIPSSVFVLTAEEIEQRSITEVYNALQTVPNTAFEVLSNGDTQITLRGQSTRNGNTDSGVGYYVDGAYSYIQSDENVSPFFDISQVNVLLGPQGTLYGRNAIGGAINIETANPTDEYQVSLNAEYGNYNTKKLIGVLNLPFSEQFAIRISGLHYERDSYFFNTTLNQPENGVEVNGLRVKAMIKPTDDIEIVLGIEGINQELPGKTQSKASEKDDLLVYEAILGHKDVKTRRLMSDIKWNLGNDIHFRAITGFRNMNGTELSDVGSSPVPFQKITTNFDVDQLTQEFRLTSSPKAGNIKWMLGANYFKDTADKSETVELVVPYSGLLGSKLTESVDGGQIEVFSGFGEATYSMLENSLHLTGSLRYSIEEKSLSVSSAYEGTPGQLAILNLFYGPPGTFRDEEETYSRLNPGVSLAYDVTKDLRTYVKYASAYKSGGINFQPYVPTDKKTFDPEDVVSYEAGVKSSWFDNKLILNASIFYQEHKDIQAAINPPGKPAGSPPGALGGSDRYFDNLGDGTTKGVELTLRALPMEGFTVDATYGYLRPTFDNGTATDQGDISGNVVPFAPEHTFSLSGEYRTNIWGDNEAYLRATYYATRGGFATANNVYKLDNKNTVDLFGGIDGKNISASFYVKNVFDTVYWQETATSVHAAVGEPIGERNAPRTYGGRVTIKLSGLE